MASTLALKAALAHASHAEHVPLVPGFRVYRRNGKRVAGVPFVGPFTRAQIRRWRQHKGIPGPGIFDAQVRHTLQRWHPPATQPKPLAPPAPAPTLRSRIVAEARWGVANEPQIHYAEVRPIPLEPPRQLPLTTDCSGFATCCYRWAGAPDPNGLGYNGAGYTGTLLAHLEHVPIAALAAGDLIVFGTMPGHHVVIVTEPGPDPLVVSHGWEGGPQEWRLSQEARYQAGRPAFGLRGLPS